MDKKTLEELDYYRIRDIIAGFCVSGEGADFLKDSEPLTDSAEIEARKLLGREWQVYLSTAKAPALSSWLPVHGIFKSITADGAALTLEQICAAGQFCTAVKKACTALQSAETELEIKALAALTRSIPDISPAAAEIFRIITPDGELKDLPELRAIRNRIAELNSKIRGILHRFTSDAKFTDALESAVPVLRGGRQVIAVKSGMRSRIPGIIHEMSQTGRTVYIEPEEAVKCSNDLVQAEFELQQETHRILRNLTSRLKPYSEALASALPVMQKLDAACAAAKWGKENGCIFALPCTDEPMLLLQARHPLLGAKAVPIDVRFMEGKRILIITGPNTGGKTVTLKTIALFSMLNQSGFPVPAAEGTRLPVFTGVFADIGDGQSLDQSLSTFSGHMKNIARAVRSADSGSLVLLDEFGSGTDPQEGAAISMSVLDKLIEKKASVLITTHQGILKNYGYTHEECINASAEFSADTLSPTYRLLIGIPGESHALDIAEKSGLPREIVEKARSYMVNEQADISALIKGLTQKHKDLDELTGKLNEKQAELNELRRRNDLKSLSIRQKEHELKLGIQGELQTFLEESRRKLENLVRTLKEGEITREKTVGVKQFIADLTESAAAMEKSLEEEESSISAETERIRQEESRQPVTHKYTKKKRVKNSEALAAAKSVYADKLQNKENIPSEFKPGAAVLAGPSHRPGTLVSAEKKDSWVVQFGSVRMTIKQKDLELAAYSNLPEVPAVTVDLVTSDESRNGMQNGIPGSKPVFELRLLGMRADEAVKALERQLDLCAIHNFLQFSIIHGKGNGILQQAVQDYLSNCPSVSDFHFAPPEDGGAGKTYVSLR